MYWMVNFRPDGAAFLVWVMWMYLNLVAAESLVVFLSALFPNFVGAAGPDRYGQRHVDGLQRFHGAGHDAQRLLQHTSSTTSTTRPCVFRGLVVNEYGYRNYSCDRTGDKLLLLVQHQPPRPMPGGRIRVLDSYGFSIEPLGKPVGITIAIIVVLRLMGWAALFWNKK